MSARRPVIAIALSAAGFIGIAVSEGYRGTAYIPVPGDVPTIGLGTTEGVKLGDTITVERALVRSLSDIAKFEGAVKQCVKVPLSQNEYDAYTRLAYNIGARNFCGSTLVEHLNNGEYAAACAEISRWNRAGGKVLRGLVNRRAEERALCEKSD